MAGKADVVPLTQRDETPSPTPNETGPESGSIAQLVGDNLRRLRTRKGLSLERLAKASGVSRAMLGQIELGRSAPTVIVLWKIAQALGVPLGVFTAPDRGGEATVMRGHRAKWLQSRNGRFATRALYPAGHPRREEFLELHVAAQTVENAESHPVGTTENLVLTRGVMEVVIGEQWHRLEAGDAIFFAADVDYVYRNPGTVEAVAFVVRVYPQRQG